MVNCSNHKINATKNEKKIIVANDDNEVMQKITTVQVTITAQKI